jgi:hypothetical protein
MRGFFSLCQTARAMTDLLLNLIAHMRWADALVADALHRAPAPSADAIRLFAHIAVVEELWYSRIEGVPAGARRLARSFTRRGARSRNDTRICSSGS